MIVIFGNITTTMRVKKFLTGKGIESAQIQTTKNPKTPDCGHGLKLNKKYYDAVKEAAAILNVKIKGVYYE